MLDNRKHRAYIEDMATTKTSVKESTVTRKILKYLNGLPGSYFFKIHGGMYTAGVADIVGCYRGRFVAFEVKSPTAYRGATKLQLEFIRGIHRARGAASVVRSLDEVRDTLALINIQIRPLRGRRASPDADMEIE